MFALSLKESRHFLSSTATQLTGSLWLIVLDTLEQMFTSMLYPLVCLITVFPETVDTGSSDLSVRLCPIRHADNIRLRQIASSLLQEPVPDFLQSVGLSQSPGYSTHSDLGTSLATPDATPSAPPSQVPKTLDGPASLPSYSEPATSSALGGPVKRLICPGLPGRRSTPSHTTALGHEDGRGRSGLASTTAGPQTDRTEPAVGLGITLRRASIPEQTTHLLRQLGLPPRGAHLARGRGLPQLQQNLVPSCRIEPQLSTKTSTIMTTELSPTVDSSDCSPSEYLEQFGSDLVVSIFSGQQSGSHLLER
ncbi:unnamed protein product [Protopolystoma xenopodis]|uniref:Uncharacterized protein n=1 Tax=Protopolystoma xenopodis TaxID=117903 RepID=A0A448XCJ7_9PLAT|nr:unnamed protein product [Protopolystoma xenopodis]